MMSIKTVVAATAAFAMTSVPAMAQSWWWWWGGSRGGTTTTTTTTTTTPASVPEIDGSTAVLAVAAILAALAFAWERNRRRA